VVTVAIADYGDWRNVARHLLTRSVSPGDVAWLSSSDQFGLPFPGLTAADAPAVAVDERPRVPRAFHSLAELASCHRSTTRWDALYRLLWRISREGREVLEQELLDDVRRVKEMAAQVRRDEHQMRAFVRFVPVEERAGVRHVAWYEPDHLIVRRAAPFFADRFGSMEWSILTPDLSAHWDRRALSFTDGVASPPVHQSGSVEELWRVYYESVFNPSRVNARAMSRDMSAKRWRRLPEATLIPRLVRTAHQSADRLNAQRTDVTARPFVPATNDLHALRQGSTECRGCRLHEAATQVVFGEGPSDAQIVLIGEQPGDAEDLAGRPFVGPSGQLLDNALAAAGLDRKQLYLTNAVKHFSFEPRGKRRIHQTPRLSEMYACRPWLEAELKAIRPTTIVAMGSTAARALLGPQARVMAIRGRVLEGLAWAPRVIVTLHPSAVLRSEGDGERYLQMLVSDLELARGEVNVSTAASGG
jgi:probable DNA metabolism protein